MSREMDVLQAQFGSYSLMSSFLLQEGKAGRSLKPRDPLYAAQTIFEAIRYRRKFQRYEREHEGATEHASFALTTTLAKLASFYHIPISEFHNNPTFQLACDAYQYMFGREDDIIDQKAYRECVKTERFSFEQFEQEVTESEQSKIRNVNSKKFFTFQVPRKLEALVTAGSLSREKAEHLRIKLQAAHDLWLHAEYEAIIDPKTDMRSAVKRIFDTSVVPAEALLDFLVPEKYCNAVYIAVARMFTAAMPFLATMVDEVLDVGGDLSEGVNTIPIAAAREAGEMSRLAEMVAKDPRFSLNPLLHQRSLPKTTERIRGMLANAGDLLETVDSKTSGFFRFMALAYTGLAQMKELRDRLPIVRESDHM